MSGARSRASVGVIALRSRLVSVAGPVTRTDTVFVHDRRQEGQQAQSGAQEGQELCCVHIRESAGGGHNQDDGKVMFVR